MFEAACCTVEKCFCFPCLCSMNYTPRLKTQFTQSLYFTCQATRSRMGHETYSFPAELSRLPRGEEDGGAGPGLGSSSRRVKVTFKVNRWIHFVCLCLLTAVPMPRTTIPVSPSRSKHCLYPVTAFPPNSRAFKPIFLRT